MEPHLGPPGPRCQHLPTIPLRLKKIKKKRRLARLVSRGAGRHAASSLSTVNEPENARDAAATAVGEEAVTQKPPSADAEHSEGTLEGGVDTMD